MIKEDRKGSKSKKANVNPTARASMLVARAKVKTTRIFLGSMLDLHAGFLRALKCPTTILPPKAARMMKATQWS